MANEAVYYGTGRRKNAVARVRLVPGTGKVTVNGREAMNYFGREALVNYATMPFKVTDTQDHFDVIALCNGGGISGQAGALRHGISRALLHNGRPVCTVGCYEQSDTESYMAAGVTDPAWQGRGLARYLIVGLANELTAERTVRFACFPALCGFYAQLGFLQIGKIQHYTTDWNTT